MSASPAASSAAVLMDRVYRHQRHIYDFTREYYLLGRDRLIGALDPPAGGTVLEIGCGTGRNLIVAARRFHDASFYGIDISSEMLATARRNIGSAGLAGRIVVAEADASSFGPAELCGHSRFDRTFFSYSLSMIPAWREALECALRAADPADGRLLIVDFGQQENLPRLFRSALLAWLTRFHVSPRAEMAEALAELAAAADRKLHFQSLYRGYAVYAEIGQPKAPRDEAAGLPGAVFP